MHRPLITLLMLVVAGCGIAERPAEDTRPNILLISIDALRADRLSCAGYTRPTTPFLDELAARGTRYSHAFVNTHGTPPSHATMLSSLYQESHRVGFGAGTPGGRNDRVPDGVEMVQEILQRAGWHTVAVTGGGYMSAAFGFDRGFDAFRGGAPGIEDGTRLLLDLLERRPKRPVFALLHTYQVHSPYQPPDPYADLWDVYDSDLIPNNKHLKPLQNRAGAVLGDDDFRRLEALYDGEIRYTDDVLRELFTALDGMGFFDRSLVIVTSDHGEEFGEHGGLLHRASLFDELIRVPLIVVGDRAPAARVDPRLVSHVDLAPTILAAAGLPVAGVMEGRDLLDATAPPPEHRQRVFAQYTDLIYTVRTPRWKLVEWTKHGRSMLFDLKLDPRELRDAAPGRPEIADRLRADLDAWRRDRPRIVEDDSTRPVLSREKIDELRALGYTE